MKQALTTWIIGVMPAMAFAQPAQAQEWMPSRNVEIVVPFAAGGGNDIPARLMQKIIGEKRLAHTSMTVVNKPGGGGTLGLIYLNEHAGDGHYLSLISTSTLTSHIIGVSKLNYTDVTPILPLITEYIGFAVNNASPYKTFGDIAEAMKNDPNSLSFAIGGGRGNPNHAAIAAALKASGVNVRKMKAVAFGGGQEALTAVLGGHVDVLAAAGSLLARQAKGGRLRIVAVAAPIRLDGELASVPTLKEQGTDAVFGFSRYIVGPKGMSLAQTTYWEKVFAAAKKTPEWKAEAEKRNWDIPAMSSSETVEDLKRQYEHLRSVLGDLSMAK